MSGGFNPISMVSQIALAAVTGGTSLIASIAMSVITQIAKEVISELGQQLGLPPAVVNAALGAFDAASGNVGGLAQGATGGMLAAVAGGAAQLGLNAAQTGEFGRVAQDAKHELRSAAETQQETYLKDALSGKDEDGGSNLARRTAKLPPAAGQSFLMRLAIALGTAIDHKMDEQMQKAQDIDGKKNSGDKSTSSTDSAELQALSQEISLMSSALTNSMKSIGEALSTMARKG